MEPTVTIRKDTPDDERAIVRLSELDSAPQPTGPRLIAEVDGEAVAAISLADGESVANPFRPTEGIVALLHARRAQLATGRSGEARRARSPRVDSLRWLLGTR